MSSRNVLDIKKVAHKKQRTAARRPAPSPATAKPRRLKEKRRRQRIVTIGICFLTAVGIVGGIGAASHADRFAINEISVTGARALPAEVVQSEVSSVLHGSILHLFSRENMFLYPRRQIESELAASFPRIKHVDVSRPSLLSQAVVVTLEERMPFARWCAQECYFVDEQGYVFADDANGETTTPFVFRGGLIPNASPVGQYFLRGRIDSVVNFLNVLKREQFKPVGATVLNEKDFLVPLEEGAVLIASFESDTPRTVHNLQTALQADSLRDALGTLEYIDLRFGNRVYYKTTLEE